MSTRRRPNRRLRLPPPSYTATARRPLQILAFLLPLILAYELALIFLLQSQENVRTVLAHKYLVRFFDAFNIAPQGGLHLGGLAIIVVLLVWHILIRDRWKIDWSACGIMACESVALAVPLLLFAQLLHSNGPAPAMLLADPGGAQSVLAGLSLPARIAICVGAGLYEELLFRMLLIAVVHTLLVDVAKAGQEIGTVIAVCVSAVAFAAYHPVPGWFELVFFLVAGLYFGAVFVWRGFGIVVAVHAIYDILTVSLMASDA